MTEKVSSSSSLELMARELKRARMERNFSLDDISRQVTIQKSYLEKIEEGDFSFLSRAYVFAYIKSYAKFLCVGNEELLEQCRKDLQISGASTKVIAEEGGSAEQQKLKNIPEESSSRKSFFSWKKLAVLIVLVVVAVLAGIYFYGTSRISETPASPDLYLPSATVEDTAAVAEQIVDTLATKVDDTTRPPVAPEASGNKEIQEVPEVRPASSVPSSSSSRRDLPASEAAPASR